VREVIIPFIGRGGNMKDRKFRSPISAGVGFNIKEYRREEGELFSLAIPIFLEFLLINIMGNVDIIMLGKTSPEAVGALGGIRQLLLIQNVIFSFICIGTTILITQLIGAGKWSEVEGIADAAIVMNLLIAIVIGGLYIIGYHEILTGMKLPGELIEIIKYYFRMVGGLCVFQALTMTYSAIMKAHGNTREVLYINLGVHMINIMGNTIFIYGLAGMPVLGVTGVGISTIVARGAGCIVAHRIVKKYYGFTFKLERVGRRLTEKIKYILTIGFPIGGQHFCWSLAQIIILSFVNTMGTNAIEARTYLMLVTSFIIAFSLGLGQGTALQVGRMIGSGERESVYKKCIRSTMLALVIAVTITSIVIFNKNGIMSVFDPSEGVLMIAQQVFIWFLFLESGRVFNIVIIASLHAAGDIKFPVAVGVVSPLFLAVSLAWILGVGLNLGLIGIWAANGIEEWIRGITMLIRWRSKKWQNKKLT